MGTGTLLVISVAPMRSHCGPEARPWGCDICGRLPECAQLVDPASPGGVALARERLWLATARGSSGALRAAPIGSLGGPQRVVPERRANPHRYWPAACRAAKTAM
eukprot:scaffold40955_cov101-Phaeocystis_antarctica.AAC.3